MNFVVFSNEMSVPFIIQNTLHGRIKIQTYSKNQRNTQEKKEIYLSSSYHVVFILLYKNFTNR